MSAWQNETMSKAGVVLPSRQPPQPNPILFELGNKKKVVGNFVRKFRTLKIDSGVLYNKLFLVLILVIACRRMSKLLLF